MRRGLALFAAIVVIAFALHLVWEYIQCGPFFVHGALLPTHAAMLLATVGDIVLTAIAFLAVAAVSRNALWALSSWGPTQWVTLEIVALLEAMTTEWMGLAMKRWSYSDLAPRFPGTDLSLLPILQLVILLPVTLAAAAWVVRRLGWTD